MRIGPDHVRVHQGGSSTLTAVVNRAFERIVAYQGVAAVHLLDKQIRESGHQLGDASPGRLHVDRNRNRVTVVLDQAEKRKLQITGDVERFPELALASRAIAA